MWITTTVYIITSSLFIHSVNLHLQCVLFLSLSNARVVGAQSSNPVSFFSCPHSNCLEKINCIIIIIRAPSNFSAVFPPFAMQLRETWHWRSNVISLVHYPVHIIRDLMNNLRRVFPFRYFSYSDRITPMTDSARFRNHTRHSEVPIYDVKRGGPLPSENCKTHKKPGTCKHLMWECKETKHELPYSGTFRD